MISCTEFIPAYSELFKFLEARGGYQEVEKFWLHLSNAYVEKLLGPEIDKKGIRGCWDYWTRALNEEAADFTMTFDTEKQEITSHMRYCPSKGLLLSLKHMTPYHAYCEHCNVIYEPVLNKRGIASERDMSHCGAASCRSRKYVARLVDAATGAPTPAVPDTGGK